MVPHILHNVVTFQFELPCLKIEKTCYIHIATCPYRYTITFFQFSPSQKLIITIQMMSFFFQF